MCVYVKNEMYVEKYIGIIMCMYLVKMVLLANLKNLSLDVCYSRWHGYIVDCLPYLSDHMLMESIEDLAVNNRPCIS